jgi:hypothetical protein
MSEGEQDALLDALEAAQRREAPSRRFLIGLACAGAAATIGGALLTLW